MANAGIYIHIPFCRTRCSYCDFATGAYEHALAETYVSVLIREIAAWSEMTKPAAIDTIYFGGGTPSLLTPAQVERILKAVYAQFHVFDGAEITLEINPASVTGAQVDAELSHEKLRRLRTVGINRASFGAQTFDDRELKLLGRTHDSGQIGETFRALRDAGFANINFDLI